MPTATATATAPDLGRRDRVDTRLKAALAGRAMPKELLICGPAGTGKTRGILTILHMLACDYHNLRILFLRQTRASLTESVLVTYEQEILAADGMEEVAAGTMRRVRQSYRYPSGSEIVLGGMDRPSRILSTSYDIVFINEAVELAEDAWETVASRLDRPGRPGALGLLIGDTNPDAPSHWLKQRCDDGRTALWETSHEANPALHDGRSWTDAGRAYLARLDRLRGTRRDRLRAGLWAASEGRWFDSFDPSKHVSEAAEFDPALPVHLAIDCGVSISTGAVLFQVRRGPTPDEDRVTVFADYYAEGLFSGANAQAILALARERCGGRLDVVTVDPAASARSGVGPAALAEYQGVFPRLGRWPGGSVTDGLDLTDSFVSVDPPALLVHPRCRATVDAFANYRRAKRNGQWQPYPESPQHPWEELMDSLRGGLRNAYPQGRRAEPVYPRRPLTHILY
jgi:hypothetical protein